MGFQEAKVLGLAFEGPGDMVPKCDKTYQ